MKVYFFTLLFVLTSICSCEEPQDNLESGSNKPTLVAVDTNTTIELNDLRDDQEKAQDVLNTIQVRGANLYSTFAFSQHDCKGDIETFTISSKDLEADLLDLMYRYYPTIDMQEKAYLALTASKARYEYEVTSCNADLKKSEYVDSLNPTRTGMWIIQTFTDQTDLIILW